MIQTPESRATGQQPAQLSVQHLALMRPELPSLIAEILAEVGANVPGYGLLLDGPYGGLIRECVQRNVAAFAARIASPGAASPERDELCRAVGRAEALNGHSMDRLQTAYRIGVQVAWRRWVKVAKRHNIPTAVVSVLADALFSYVDEMTALSRAGHAEGRARSGRLIEEQRARLLSRLVSAEPASREVLAEIADRAAWPLPDEATPVAIGVAPGAAPDPAALDDDVLADIGDPRPHLLIPGPMTASREEMLARFLGSASVAIGLTVRLSDVAHSLRWARRTLAMGPALGADDGPTRSEDHLLSLWLCSDPDLARCIADRHLAPLRGFTGSRRVRLTDTLLAWFSTRGNVEQMAKSLGIHPQTVRYRMRILHKAFGSRLDDAEWRLATELVLRGQSLVSDTTAAPARETSDDHDAGGG